MESKVENAWKNNQYITSAASGISKKDQRRKTSAQLAGRGELQLQKTALTNAESGGSESIPNFTG